MSVIYLLLVAFTDVSFDWLLFLFLLVLDKAGETAIRTKSNDKTT